MNHEDLWNKRRSPNTFQCESPDPVFHYDLSSMDFWGLGFPDFKATLPAVANRFSPNNSIHPTSFAETTSITGGSILELDQIPASVPVSMDNNQVDFDASVSELIEQFNSGDLAIIERVLDDERIKLNEMSKP